MNPAQERLAEAKSTPHLPGDLTNKNPFVEYHSATWWKKYPSDENYRVVWLKGKKAKVSEVGSHFCPVMNFDTVAFVWMHPRVLPITFSQCEFVTSEALPLKIQLSLTAKVHADSLSLISVATCFADSVEVLTQHAATFLHTACKRLNGQSIIGHETTLSAEIKEHFGAEPEKLKLPFEVLDAHLKLTCSTATSVIREDTSEALLHGLEKQRLDRAAALAAEKRKHELAELTWKLEADWKQFERTQEKLRLESKTRGEMEEATLSRLKAMESLCIEAKLMAAHNPELASRIAEIEKARLANDAQAREVALKQILEQLKAVGEVSRGAYPPGANGGVSIVNNK